MAGFLSLFYTCRKRSENVDPAADVMFLWEEVENRESREGDGDFMC